MGFEPQRRVVSKRDTLTTRPWRHLWPGENCELYLKRKVSYKIHFFLNEKSKYSFNFTNYLCNWTLYIAYKQIKLNQQKSVQLLMEKYNIDFLKLLEIVNWIPQFISPCESETGSSTCNINIKKHIYIR